MHEAACALAAHCEQQRHRTFSCCSDKDQLSTEVTYTARMSDAECCDVGAGDTCGTPSLCRLHVACMQRKFEWYMDRHPQYARECRVDGNAHMDNVRLSLVTKQRVAHRARWNRPLLSAAL